MGVSPMSSFDPEHGRDAHATTMTQPFDPADFQTRINRRTFLARTGLGLGGFALASLLNPGLASAASLVAQSDARWKGVINPPHFPVKAKRVIHLCMAG